MDGEQPMSASDAAQKLPASPLFVDPEERLKFETLIADLSARFINVPADQVGAEIQNAQRRIVEALDLDRSSLWQADEREPGGFWLTSVYEPGRPIIERAPSKLVLSQDWMLEDQGEKTAVSR